jgi:hypothetical protein
MDIIIIIILVICCCCCCCIIVSSSGFYFLNSTAQKNTQDLPSSSSNISTPAPTTPAPTTPAPLMCNINAQALLGNKTCNYWSWKDERTEQRPAMPNYQQTGTVPPGWDCWYEPKTQCVSRECLKSSDPTKDCGKRNTF